MTRKNKIKTNIAAIVLFDLLILSSGVSMYINGKVDLLNVSVALISAAMGVRFVLKTRDMILG